MTNLQKVLWASAVINTLDNIFVVMKQREEIKRLKAALRHEVDTGLERARTLQAERDEARVQARGLRERIEGATTILDGAHRARIEVPIGRRPIR